MGICNKQRFLLVICVLQVVATIERQVFDFLGYMWIPIAVNFFNIVFTIFGFFGAYQYRPRYLLAYAVWNLMWLAWNIFIICFYLEVGSLDRKSDVLNFGTGSFSWWEVNGVGCRPFYSGNFSDPIRPVRPDSVTGCVLDYEYVEVLHAAVQIALSVLGSIVGMCLARSFMEEDDTFDYVGGFDPGPPPPHVTPKPVAYRGAPHLSLQPVYAEYAPVPQPPSRRSSRSLHASTASLREKRRSLHASTPSLREKRISVVVDA